MDILLDEISEKLLRLFCEKETIKTNELFEFLESNLASEFDMVNTTHIKSLIRYGFVDMVDYDSHEDTFQILQKGRAFIKQLDEKRGELKFNQEHAVNTETIARESNEIAKKAKGLSKQSNILSLIAIGISAITLIASIIIAISK